MLLPVRATPSYLPGAQVPLAAAIVGIVTSVVFAGVSSVLLLEVQAANRRPVCTD